jgi:hypothetical protein
MSPQSDIMRSSSSTTTTNLLMEGRTTTKMEGWLRKRGKYHHISSHWYVDKRKLLENNFETVACLYKLVWFHFIYLFILIMTIGMSVTLYWTIRHFRTMFVEEIWIQRGNSNYSQNAESVR